MISLGKSFPVNLCSCALLLAAGLAEAQPGCDPLTPPQGTVRDQAPPG